MRSVLAALVLLSALPAHAGAKPHRAKAWMVNNYEVHPIFGLFVSADDPSDDPTSAVASVAIELRSDSGDEDLDLVESDAWLHGAGTLAALPKTDAALTLALYDAGGAALSSFDGTLSSDGVVTLTTRSTGADCATRGGCDTSDPDTLDLEVLSADVFVATKGYDVAFDLAGADTYAVAYAKISVVEGAITTCDKAGCTTSGGTTSSAEVDWDTIGSVWAVDLAQDHDGVIEVEAVLRGADGKKSDTASYTFAAPWLDDGGGVSTLALDDDYGTTVALTSTNTAQGKARTIGTRAVLTVGSSGWSAGDLPTHARLDTDGGDSITVAVSTYQRKATKLDVVGYGFDVRVLSPKARLAVVGGDVALKDLSLEQLRTPVCSDGTCVVLVEDELGQLGLSVTSYSADADALPDSLDLKLSVTDELGGESWPIAVEFDKEIEAIFATELTFDSDPVGLGLSGKVYLLGAANKKGKQETLTKGSFHGAFGRDDDGDLALVGADTNDETASAAVSAGDAVGLTDTNGDPSAPPVVVYGVMGNGSGTKNASSQTSTRPQLL